MGNLNPPSWQAWSLLLLSGATISLLGVLLEFDPHLANGWIAAIVAAANLIWGFTTTRRGWPLWLYRLLQGLFGALIAFGWILLFWAIGWESSSNFG
jgi:hypothetical protein